jgi:hypothetical protein
MAYVLAIIFTKQSGPHALLKINAYVSELQNITEGTFCNSGFEQDILQSFPSVL